MALLLSPLLSFVLERAVKEMPGLPDSLQLRSEGFISDVLLLRRLEHTSLGLLPRIYPILFRARWESVAGELGL